MPHQRTYIIAEAGVNHNGRLDQARKLVEVAADSGADCVKFQTFTASKLVTQIGELAKYQREQGESGSQLEMLQRLELSKEDHIDLRDHSQQNNIEFLSTPFDLDSLDFLASLPMSTIKIASGELTNYPLLKATGKLKRPTILSTGMATLDEIKAAVNLLVDSGLPPDRLSILHCNTDYPTPFRDVNLNAIETLKREFPDHPIGYSDHSSGIEVPIAAVALGATIIEKHFTLSRDQAGPDHAASLLPSELKQMVDCIRNIEAAMGDGIKTPSPGEQANREVARKSIVASKPIRNGEHFTEDNLTTKRPGTGRNPMDWPLLVGATADRDYNVDDLIQ